MKRTLKLVSLFVSHLFNRTNARTVHTCAISHPACRWSLCCVWSSCLRVRALWLIACFPRSVRCGWSPIYYIQCSVTDHLYDVISACFVVDHLSAVISGLSPFIIRVQLALIAVVNSPAVPESGPRHSDGRHVLGELLLSGRRTTQQTGSGSQVVI